MSRYLSERFSALEPYTPGEQPQDMQYTKLNTNESPFPPCPAVVEAAAEQAQYLNLYSDPTCGRLCRAAAKLYGVEPENVMAVNGSDEALYFAFLAFCDQTHPVAFPDVSYSFYPVSAALCGIEAKRIPLRPDFSIAPEDYADLDAMIVIANPNAPTGMAMRPDQIEQILQANRRRVVVIDEAYVDFGAQSCVDLIGRYDNLLVVQTFSKSRSLAGGRLGFAIGCKALIQDLNAIRFSINPYNVNRMTQAAGVAACEHNKIYLDHCRVIAENRDMTTARLTALGFTVLPSLANFVFARHEELSGELLYRQLKQRGVLVRHFSRPEITQYLRITIGTREQMARLFSALEDILNRKEF